MDVKGYIHQAARALHKTMQDPESWVSVGICVFISEYDPESPEEEIDRALAKMFKRWPEFSGDPWYPVPYLHENPRQAYNNGSAFLFWDRERSPYAAARWRLLEYIITETKGQ